MVFGKIARRLRNCCIPIPPEDDTEDGSWTEWLFESCGHVDSEGARTRVLTRGFENADGRVLVKVNTYKDGEFVESKVFTTDEKLGAGGAMSLEMTPPAQYSMT